MRRHKHIFTISIITIFLLLSYTSQCIGIPVLSDRKKTAKPIQQTKRAVSPVILGQPNDISKYKTHSPLAAVNIKNDKIKGQLSAKSAIIIDARTGETLFAISPDTPRQPASTIKIITGMIALKSLTSNEKIPVSNKAARQPRSKVYLDSRKTYKANDLINAVLLASANDASVALAEKIAGSEQSFAQMMTVRAKIWGAKKTVCKTATGLTAKGQKSTARDLATIFKHIMKDDDFVQRIKRTKIKTSFGSLLRNHNRALWQVDGSIGGKTGYTRAARQTYVGKFKRGKQEIIIAFMASNRMWSDVEKLVNHGFYVKRQFQLAQKQKTRQPNKTMAQSSS